MDIQPDGQPTSQSDKQLFCVIHRSRVMTSVDGAIDRGESKSLSFLCDGKCCRSMQTRQMKSKCRIKTGGKYRTVWTMIFHLRIPLLWVPIVFAFVWHSRSSTTGNLLGQNKGKDCLNCFCAQRWWELHTWEFPRPCDLGVRSLTKGCLYIYWTCTTKLPFGVG